VWVARKTYLKFELIVNDETPESPRRELVYMVFFDTVYTREGHSAFYADRVPEEGGIGTSLQEKNADLCF